MGVDTSVLYLMRGGKPMKKIIAIILVITMLACNSVNAASFVQDKKVELNNEHMKDYNDSSVKWKFDEKSSVLSFSGCEKLEKVDVGQIKNQVRYIVLADDIKENAMSGGTPARLRGLAANGNSISPTLEEVMNAMGIYTYSFTLAAKEEKDLGDLGDGMYLLASPNNAATAIFAFGSYSKGFVSDAGSNFYCDYTDGTKGVAFGRKTTNGSFFIKNNRSTETYIVLKRIGTL